MPKVSVIIPVYNVEKYLQACIDSLLNQTLEDIELIFVNDASPDNCSSILHENEQLHPDKIRVIDLPENLRQGGARNVGIKAAKSDIIGFVDSDDFVAPEMFEKPYMKICSTDADVVYGKFLLVDENATVSSMMNVTGNGEKWPILMSCKGKLLNEEDRNNLMISPLPLGCGLYKKALFVDNEIWFPEHIRFEDNYWGVIYKCFVNVIDVIDDVVYFYRQVSTSTIHVKNMAAIYERIEIERRLLAYMKKNNLLETYYSAMEYININRATINTFMDFLRKSDIPPKTDLLALVKALKTNFPQWHKNKYYCEMYTSKQKIRANLIINFPRLYLLCYKVIDRGI